MSSNKITWVHVSLIGAVIMLIVGFALFFLMIKPINEGNQKLQTEVSGLQTTTVDVDGGKFTYSQITPAKAKLELAKQRKADREAELNQTLRSKSLPSSKALYIPKDPDKNQALVLAQTLPRWLLLPKNVVLLMEAFAQKLAKKYGVKVQTVFATKAPSTVPADIPTDIVAWDLGGMTVTGDFQRVMQWTKAWNTAPLLCSVNDLKCQLTDRNGKITATCSLAAYVFPSGPGASSGPSAGGGGGGGGGGAPGGFGGGMGNGPGAGGAFSPKPGGSNGP